MLMSERLRTQLYFLLYTLVFVLLISPWMYYDAAAIDYSFLPKKLISLIVALVAGLILLFEMKTSYEKIAVFFFLFGLGGLHYAANGYFEPHYFFQIAYMEIALLISFAPTNVKETMLKYSTIVFYALLAKAYFYKIGSYFHGGFLSSNLFAAYIVYMSILEVYKKQYWNLIPAIVVLYFVGSKASYMSMATLGLMLAVAVLMNFSVQTRSYYQKLRNYKLIKKNNFFLPIIVAFFSILIFTKVMTHSNYFKSWEKKMAPSKVESTKNNMIMYGLDKSKESKKKREVFLITKEMQFKEKEVSIVEKPLITDLSVSIGTRVEQYDYMYSNLKNYFWVGDTIGSQAKMMGHNPHSSIIDFISRLGVLYFILILLMYAGLFKAMNLFTFNVVIIPTLAFQPYGFSIGHSIVILSLIYSLAKIAHDKKVNNYLL